VQPGAGRPFQRRRLRYDPGYRLEASYAVEHGIPWEEYLERWSPQSRAVVQAVLAENALRCQTCGTAGHEWETDDAFVAVDSVCPGCAARDRKRADSETGPMVPGSSIKLVPQAMARALAGAPISRPRSARERAREAQ
jgi:hypothetical protein